ncbi:hypothetical protein RUM43_009461 [Polyplax serrata]|uniref:Uncharacterized protein n=1 Tax=Polyplax serrata TaxID=468196 RepID=A0AAN8PWE7_POLSC
MDPAKLKVVELRAELAKRGLDQKGVKAVLVTRLQEALEAEEKDEEEDEEEEEEEPEELEAEQNAPKSGYPGGQDETSAQSVQSSEPEITHPEEDSMQFISHPEESESKFESEVNEDSVTHHPPDSEPSSDIPAMTDDISIQSVEYSDSKPVYEMSGDSSEPPYPQSVTVTDVTQDPDVSKYEDESKDNFLTYEEDSSKSALQDDSSSKKNFEDQSLDTWGQQDTKPYQMEDSSFHLDDSNAQDALENRQKECTVEDIKHDIKSDPDEKPNVVDIQMDVKLETNAEVKEDIEMDVNRSEEQGNVEKQEDEEKFIRKGDDRKNRWNNTRPTEAKKRQRSPSEKRKPSPPRKPDDEPDYDEKAVLLIDSDLHMLINKENFFSATLLSDNGFGYVWAGARATYGFEKGKIYYEVRITKNLKVPYLENELHPNILRVGWSVQKTSLQLGEEPLSYGFGGTGKISTNCQFQNYGKPFIVNDVVGCYLNFDGNQIEISYTLNGEYQGVAYNIDHEELKGQPLFPHILSKNCSFEVNFGNREPWAQILPGFTNVGEIPLEDRIMGPKRPEKREDCEVIMMCGLPASGKTTWASKYAQENKDKMYNILGTNALIDKMKVMGMPRRRNYSGRWEVLIEKCTKCLNTLLEIGACRRRNYIIDQTNVYPAAQRRKMRGFEGFVRRAVVIVPTDEELKSRTAKLEAEEGKDVPDSAILEMKANFALPEKGDIFSEVIYTELKDEEAKALVAQYNKEGNDQGYFSNFQQQKRFRMDDNRNDRRDFRHDGGDHRRMDNRRPDNRGGHDSWRDRGFNNRRRGDNRGGWGPPRQGGWRDNRGGGGGWRAGPPNRYNDRGGHNSRDMRDRNRGYRDRRDNSGGNKMQDRRGDRDDKSRQKSMPQGQVHNWSNQSQGGYNQSWNQNYGNQAWGNWNQDYQQQWKNYGQQQQQQAWGQQGWSNQNWGNSPWHPPYYNQYQQSWAQQPQQTQGGTTAADSSQTTGSDSSTMAAAYSSYGQTAGGTQAGQWSGYTTVGSTGYATVGSSGGTSGAGTGNSGGSSVASYTTMQKQ